MQTECIVNGMLVPTTDEEVLEVVQSHRKVGVEVQLRTAPERRGISRCRAILSNLEYEKETASHHKKKELSSSFIG